MVLSFPTRRSAEMAAVQGTEFNGKQLSLSWFTGQTNKTSVAVAPQKIQRRITRSLSQSLMDKDLEDELVNVPEIALCHSLRCILLNAFVIVMVGCNLILRVHK